MTRWHMSNDALIAAKVCAQQDRLAHRGDADTWDLESLRYWRASRSPWKITASDTRSAPGVAANGVHANAASTWATA